MVTRLIDRSARVHAELLEWARRRQEPNLQLTRTQAEGAHFCFLGEFGYELISWIPYLNYLATVAGVKLTTVSRPGSALFYPFSASHVEIDGSLLGGCWGRPGDYRQLSARFPNTTLVYPGESVVNRRRIAVEGIEWTTHNIHAPVSGVNYALPDYSRVRAELPVPEDRPVVVINNKYDHQWPDQFAAPVNFFDRDALVAMKALLTRAGAFVVYNRPSVAGDPRGTGLRDEHIFGIDDDSIDMRLYYDGCAASDINVLQVGLFNRAALVIGPQGGNLYLPAFCRCPLVMLMRAGDYVDYQEIGRLCGVSVDAFYEPRHLLCWLETGVLRSLFVTTARVS